MIDRRSDEAIDAVAAPTDRKRYSFSIASGDLPDPASEPRVAPRGPEP